MATKKTTQAGPADKGLQIQSRSADGFSRCGLRFGPEATVVPFSELSADDVERLRAEPQLVVVDVDIAPV